MKAKKIIAAVLLAVFVFALTACGADNGSTGNKKYDLLNYDFSEGIDDNGYFRNVKASDYVNIPDYKNVTIPDTVLTASETEVQNQIDGILESMATYEQITDAAVKDGDTVNIDYVGSVDGVEFAGGTTQGMGTEVTIGVTSYIDDFLEQLIGHMPGETINVEVTFPVPYQNNPDLAGKDALFVTTINYICGEEIIPEMNDEIASEFGFDSAADLEADIASWIIEQQTADFFNEFINGATAKAEIPQSVMDFIIYSDLSYYQNYADMYSMTLDDFLSSQAGYENVDAYIQDNSENFRQTAVAYLAVQAIAEAEGITITDEDVSDAGMSDYIEYYGMPYLKQYVLQTVKIPSLIINK